ncbi:MAG: hypothetical protein IBX64_05585 [Actinobacteria bacterium]|nr:hypothetical protein [Actinomycetota bacterium]
MDLASSINAPNKKNTCGSDRSDSSEIGKVAFLWDESFLWGLIAYKTFLQLGINFDLVTSVDIRKGSLNTYDVLFVPGGWASNKVIALGENGKDRIRRFIEEGGSYLGFCGGAGMALQHNDGLSLMPVNRKPTSARVPSFSGKICLRQELTGHPIWKNIPDNNTFYAWWPGQFSIANVGDIKVLARYGDPGEGSFISDLLINPSIDWGKWEQSYKTNLNPNRIKGEPAVIEANHGRGKVLLSYLHFETPEDRLGHEVLLNILDYLAEGKSVRRSEGSPKNSSIPVASANKSLVGNKIVSLASELKAAALDLISFGEKNFLWNWRNSWIIQWRRGVRGIEYCTIYAMLKQLSELTAVLDDFDEETIVRLIDLKGLILPFFEESKRLLILERYAMNYGPLSPLKSGDMQIQQMRKELFSNSKRFGGRYKQIIDRIDDILLPLLISAKDRGLSTLCSERT